MNCRHPETPTCTLSRINLANEDPDDEGDDLNDALVHDDEDDGLSPQDCIFMCLSEAINNLVCNNHCTSSSDDSKVKFCELVKGTLHLAINFEVLQA
jgi:hypothetical protein